MDEKKQYIITEFVWIDNKKYRKIMTSSKGIEMTYQWLKRHIVRAPMQNVYLKEVYNRFFVNKILATSINIDKLAQSLFISRNTLLKNLKILEDNKIIEKTECDFKSIGGKQVPQNVYKFGTWKTKLDSEGNEQYFENFYVDKLITEEAIYGNKN